MAASGYREQLSPGYDPKTGFAIFFYCSLNFKDTCYSEDQNKPSSIINQGIKAGMLSSMTGRDCERAEEGKEGG